MRFFIIFKEILKILKDEREFNKAFKRAYNPPPKKLNRPKKPTPASPRKIYIN